MVQIDFFKGYADALTGRDREFEELLSAGDIDAVKEKMGSRMEKADEALREYNVSGHEVMKREDKLITDKRGNFIRKEAVWKLPIPYQSYINEVALVFLYGRPVKWVQLSEQTDAAFGRFVDVLKRTRFDSKIRQCKRLAGAETESAMLFRVYKGDDGKPNVQVRVLARSKGDEIYTRFDQYENLITAAWGYYAKEENNTVAYHFDVFTPKATHRCVRRGASWEVEVEPNFVGKIPLIIFHQEKEWKGVERLIQREEHIASRTADTNDYFADPVMVMAAELIKNMPEKKEAAKLLVTNDKDGTDKAARYLTWDSAPQSKKDELEWLQGQILSKTFTPKISLDALKSLSNLSAKALRTVMLLADIKAARHKEVHDELLDRTASLITSIIGNVLDISLKGECERLVIGHEFQEPFGDDVKDGLDNIIRSIEAGVLSEESAVEMNPLVKNVEREKERLSAEKSDRERQQLSVFGGLDGDVGPQTFDEGNKAAAEMKS